MQAISYQLQASGSRTRHSFLCPRNGRIKVLEYKALTSYRFVRSELIVNMNEVN